ncbi:hypothetical protein Nmel_005087 [Mimus melanotis]
MTAPMTPGGHRHVTAVTSRGATSRVVRWGHQGSDIQRLFRSLPPL